MLADYNVAKRKIKNRKSLNVLSKYYKWCEQSKLKKIQICLNFLNSHRLFNNLVVGFDNAKQYEDFLNCNKNPMKSYPKKIFTDNVKLVNLIIGYEKNYCNSSSKNRLLQDFQKKF